MSIPSVQVRLTVSKAIDPAARQVACAQAQEAAVLSLWLDGQLTTAEAAQEVGLSSQACEEWLMGAEVPLRSDALRQRRLQKKMPQIEVARRDLSYYDDVFQLALPGTAPTPEDD